MVQSSSYERERETVLMKVMGAKRKFLWKLSASEFLFYSLLSGGMALIMAVVTTYFINIISFHSFSLVWSWWATVVLLFVIFATVCIGALQMKRILKNRPATVLRKQFG
jgi:predicted lysophospholipase L1 biosynthesis ABC-type transport system permease subunit